MRVTATHSESVLDVNDQPYLQILASNDFDKKAFQANSQRLEQRLFSLGLLRRLSDGCAYIINPYFPR